MNLENQRKSTGPASRSGSSLNFIKKESLLIGKPRGFSQFSSETINSLMGKRNKASKYAVGTYFSFGDDNKNNSAI